MVKLAQTLLRSTKKEFKNMGGYSKHIKTCKYVNTIKDNIIYQHGFGL